MFLVMELVNGGDLYLFKERSFKFSEEQTRSFAAQIICGIQFLHSNKIVHRFVVTVELGGNWQIREKHFVL